MFRQFSFVPLSLVQFNSWYQTDTSEKKKKKKKEIVLKLEYIRKFI